MTLSIDGCIKPNVEKDQIVFLRGRPFKIESINRSLKTIKVKAKPYKGKSSREKNYLEDFLERNNRMEITRYFTEPKKYIDPSVPVLNCNLMGFTIKHNGKIDKLCNSSASIRGLEISLKAYLDNKKINKFFILRKSLSLYCDIKRLKPTEVKKTIKELGGEVK